MTSMSLSVPVLRQTVKSVLPQKYLTRVVSVRCSAAEVVNLERSFFESLKWEKG